MPRTFALAILLALLVPSTAAAAFKAHGSVRQVYVTGAKPGTKVTVGGQDEARGPARRDRLPRRQARHLPVRGKQVRVFSDRSAPPSKKCYKQKLPKSGYGYLTTRDGTKLAINVHLPSGPGPYPTLIEYAGYGYANPDGAQSGISPIANLLGYAVVDVNMRGTGCSGGAFDYFEQLQSLDGYDIIETVARQSWVARHKVGMMGVSYGGISQLFVAQTRPPSLAAITPLSVVDNTQTTLYPGGILNTGFTLAWAKDRAHDAQPASKTGGQAVGAQAHQGRRQDLQGQPGAARRGARPDRQGARQRPLRAEGRRPARARQVREEDRRADLPRLPVHRRADRRALRVAAEALHRHEAQVVHVHQRQPHRLARPRDVHALVRLPRALRRAPPAAPVRTACAPPRRWSSSPPWASRASTCPTTRSRRSRPTTAALAAFQAQPSVRILFDNGAGSDAVPRPSPASSARSRASRCRGRPRARGTSRRAARWPTPSRPRRGPTRSSGAARRGRRRASSATPGSGTNGLWTATPRTSGRRTRRAPRRRT